MIVHGRIRANSPSSCALPGFSPTDTGFSSSATQSPTGDVTHAYGDTFARLLAARYGTDHPGDGIEFINRGINGTGSPTWRPGGRRMVCPFSRIS